MKILTLTIATLILIILASHIAISYDSNSYKLKTFVIDGNKENTDHHNVKTNYKNIKTNCHNLKANNSKVNNFKANHIKANNLKAPHNNMKTFVIDQKPSGSSMLSYVKMHTQDARKRNLQYHQRDEEISKCIDKITKNWKRTYYKTSYEKEYDDDTGKWIITKTFPEKQKEFYGYDKDEDFWFKWKLRNRALNGEEIC